MRRRTRILGTLALTTLFTLSFPARKVYLVGPEQVWRDAMEAPARERRARARYEAELHKMRVLGETIARNQSMAADQRLAQLENTLNQYSDITAGNLGTLYNIAQAQTEAIKKLSDDVVRLHERLKRLEEQLGGSMDEPRE